MGITGFYSFFGHLFNKIPLNTLDKHIIFVDAALYIHKNVIGIRRKGTDIKTKNGKSISHIYAIKRLVESFININILPICVFDGKAPELKEETIEKRKNITETAIEKCIKLKENNIEETDEEYIKNFKRSFIFTSVMIKECKDFLDALGLPHVTSVSEADPQCVALSHYYQNYTSGTFSEDSDILLYGGNIMLRDLDLKNNTIMMIDIKDILSFLQEKADNICIKYNIKKIIITKEIFCDFSIIMGNDYCQGIRCNGGNNRDKLFEIYIVCECDTNIFINTLHKLNNDKINYYIPINFLERYLESKNIYKNIEVISPSTVKINVKLPHITKLNNYPNIYDIKHTTIKILIDSMTKLYNNFHLISNEIHSICKSSINQNNSDWQIVNKKKKIYVC
jgi:flap endonuclease-1